MWYSWDRWQWCTGRVRVFIAQLRLSCPFKPSLVFLLKGVNLKKEFAFCPSRKQVWTMPFMVTQASSVMMSSPPLTNGAQDLHENFLCIGDAAFPELSNQMNWTHIYRTQRKWYLRMFVIHGTGSVWVGNQEDAGLRQRTIREDRQSFQSFPHSGTILHAMQNLSRLCFWFVKPVRYRKAWTQGSRPSMWQSFSFLLHSAPTKLRRRVCLRALRRGH